MTDLIHDFNRWNHRQYLNRYCFNCRNFLDHNLNKTYMLGVLKCEHRTFEVEKYHTRGIACPEFKPTLEYRLNKLLNWRNI